ncbi:hypothetical protein IEQ34_009167 [Dendrobium chrysotoxum]|uniref:GRF-type domain-containing protein n=1 Tax=Dendrobium chrysotoxum TaxID=161865 RepID=A0AAV7GYH4_DENCH|nr:hypothetical protein IEQ34_009167 [Dendrobium chrysotoxum]
MIELCVDKSYVEATFDEAIRELHERNDMALCRIREYECMSGAHGNDMFRTKKLIKFMRISTDLRDLAKEACERGETRLHRRRVFPWPRIGFAGVVSSLGLASSRSRLKKDRQDGKATERLKWLQMETRAEQLVVSTLLSKPSVEQLLPCSHSTMSSSPSARPIRNPSTEIYCYCNLQCTIFTSYKSRSYGRKFYRCSRNRLEGDCCFFQWCDELNDSHSSVQVAKTSPTQVVLLRAELVQIKILLVIVIIGTQSASCSSEDEASKESRESYLLKRRRGDEASPKGVIKGLKAITQESSAKLVKKIIKFEKPHILNYLKSPMHVDIHSEASELNIIISHQFFQNFWHNFCHRLGQAPKVMVILFRLKVFRDHHEINFVNTLSMISHHHSKNTLMQRQNNKQSYDLSGPNLSADKILYTTGKSPITGRIFRRLSGGFPTEDNETAFLMEFSGRFFPAEFSG